MPPEQHIEDADITVVGEAQVADTSFLLLLHEPIQYAVVHVAGIEGLQRIFVLGRTANAMQQQIIDIVGFQIAERTLKHRLRLLSRPCIGREIAQLGSHKITATRMASQGDACRFLRMTLAIDRRGIEVVDNMRQGIVHQFVDSILINGRIVVIEQCTGSHGWQTHHTKAQERHLIARVGIDAIGHLPFGHLRLDI